MVWLYLPESEVSTLESISFCQNQELFVMWRGKPMRPQYWQNKWKKGGFIRRLSGLMLSPSMASLGVEKWISSVRGSLVSHGVLQGNKKELKTSDGYGTILKESFAKFNRDSYSWRMSQVSLMGDYLPYSSPWPKSGSMLNGALYERQMLAQTIIEIGCLSLDIFPTPNASLMATEGSTRLTRALYLNGKATLEEATAINQGYNPLKKKGAMKEIFPTPNAADGMRTNLTHQRGNPTLLGAVQMWPTPDASPQKYRLRGDSQQSKSLNGLHGGKLNPEWVEWLMGWPIGWTDLEHAETGSSHFKQDSLIQSSSIELSKGGA